MPSTTAPWLRDFDRSWPRQRWGAEQACQRHVARGKLLPREWVGRLLDPGSPFLEVGALAAHGMYGGAPRISLAREH